MSFLSSWNKYRQIKYSNGQTELFFNDIDLERCESLLNGNEKLIQDVFEVEDYEVFHMQIQN